MGSTPVIYTTQAGKSNYSWVVQGVNNTDYQVTAGSLSASSNTVSLRWLTSGSKTVTVNYSTGTCAGLAPASYTTVVGTYGSPSVTIAGNATTCYGGAVTYTATPVNGPVSYQWKKDASNVGTNSATYVDAGIAGGVITCVITSTVPCAGGAQATSNSITLSVTPNAWTGAVSNNFSVGGNWCSGVVPTGAANISIPGTAINMPKLFTNVVFNNLTIASGGTIDINGYSMTINGTLSGAGFIKGSIYSTIAFTGTVPGTLNMDPTANSLKVLHMTGASGTLSLSNALDMYDSVDVRAGTLATGGFMTLKSNQSATARIGIITTGSITGNVTVERWLRNVSRRTFRVLSVPTQGSQTIKQAWMENNAPLGNTNPGYGTLLTSTFGVAQGYDATTTDNSLLRWNPTTSMFDYAGATSTAIATTGGYYVYIRGDRSVLPGGSVTTTTTLRTNGTLYQGSQSAVSATGGVNTVVGNVYASAIDFTKLNTTITAFKIWDPALSGSGTTTGAGAYQTFSSANGWVPTPGGGSYGTAASVRIENGQAFIVSPATTSTITFTEYAKATGSRQIQRQSNVIQRMKTNLYAVNGANVVLTDGNVAVFDNSYSIGTDNYDVIKMNNFSENFGISNSSRILTIDARPEIAPNDEIQFTLSNMQAQQYSFEFTTENLDATTLTAYLVDNYLHTQTPITLNSTQNVTFKVTGDAASAASNRFKVVFKGTGTLPVTFTTIRANERNRKVAVEWSVASEKNIRSYTVEQSADGRTFSGVGLVAATANGASKADYNWLHENPVQGNNYYRIRSEGIGGEIKYSTVARAFVGEGLKPSYVVAPNPVTDGNVNVQFVNQSEGRYAIRLLNATGQTVYSRSVNHSGGNSTNRIGLSSGLSNGLYKIEILQPDNGRYVQNLVIGNSK